MRAPTDARFLNDPEWVIVSDVFQSTLPFRHRILLTDAAGADNRPFTIPTAAISVLTIPAAIQAALSGFVTAKLGAVGEFVSSVSNWTGYLGIGSIPSQIAGMVNLGYLVNVGPTAYPDLSAGYSGLLVHEIAHVWQGKNSRSATTYVSNSIMHQCRSYADSASHGGAYSYTPGGTWSAYNAEQQASVIEDWYLSGKPHSGDLWPYIRDHVRHGRV
jgi:hypothetical protein